MPPKSTRLRLQQVNLIKMIIMFRLGLHKTEDGQTMSVLSSALLRCFTRPSTVMLAFRSVVQILVVMIILLVMMMIMRSQSMYGDGSGGGVTKDDL